MVQKKFSIIGCASVAEGVHRLSVRAPEIARAARPGQFVNIRAHERIVSPLLRRPFSISRVEGDTVALLFNVVGTGTSILSTRQVGEELDILGPLGKPFCLEDEFDVAVMVAGGLGVAPFPFLTDVVKGMGREVMTFAGARTAAQIVRENLVNEHMATDDGSEGFHGTVVDAVAKALDRSQKKRLKLFGCGPTAMLRALSTLARDRNLPCELSLEGSMACGVGICQGCPVRRSGEGKTYALVCTDGPAFPSSEVIL